MALKAWSLTTVQRAADYLGLGTIVAGSVKETVLTALINSVTDFIESQLGYRVKKTAYSYEVYDTEKSKYLNLKNFPIDSGATFTLFRRDTTLNQSDWETVDSEYYFVDMDAGIITATAGGLFAKSYGGYAVSYTAGYDFNNSTTFLSDTQGGAIELAAWMLVSSLYYRRKGGAGVTSESIGDYSVGYASALMNNPDIQALLEPFSRIEAVGVITPTNV